MLGHKKQIQMVSHLPRVFPAYTWSQGFYTIVDERNVSQVTFPCSSPLVFCIGFFHPLLPLLLFASSTCPSAIPPTAENKGHFLRALKFLQSTFEANFYVERADIGKPLAACVVKSLSEMNTDPTG
jgi:hypothetical protein